MPSEGYALSAKALAVFGELCERAAQDSWSVSGQEATGEHCYCGPKVIDVPKDVAQE